MGHVVFVLIHRCIQNTNNVYGNVKDQMKLDLYIWSPKLYAGYVRTMHRNCIFKCDYQLPLKSIVLHFENVSSKNRRRHLLTTKLATKLAIQIQPKVLYMKEPAASYILLHEPKSQILDSMHTTEAPAPPTTLLSSRKFWHSLSKQSFRLYLIVLFGPPRHK